MKHSHKLPDNLIPEGDICVPFLVPDDADYINLIIRQLRQLTLDRHYQRDDDKSALIVRDVMATRMYQPFIDALANGDSCQQSNGFDCLRLTTTENVIKFQYNDPFLPNSEDGNASQYGEWARWQDLRDLLPKQVENFIDAFENLTTLDADMGYFPNDCIIFPAIPDNPIDAIFGGLADLALFKFPFITVELIGSGEFEIELLNVPLGGTAMIAWDYNPNVGAIIQDLIDGNPINLSNTIFTELSRDMSQIPPSTLERNSVEIQFESEGEHIIRVYFLPTIDYTNAQFLGFGGGVRSVTACGNLQFVGIDGQVINQSNYGLREARDGVIPVSTVDDFYDALIRYEDQRAMRWLSAQTGNIQNGIDIEVNEQSGLTSRISSGIEIPSPDTNADTNELRMGGVYGWANGISDVVQEVKDLNTASFTNLQIAKLTSVLANPIDFGAWQAIIDSYVNLGLDVTIDVDALAQKLFCEYSVGVGVIKYCRELVSGSPRHTSAETEFIVDAVSEIQTSQYQEWYQLGQLSPRTGYQLAPCYRVENETITVEPADVVTSPVFNFLQQEYVAHPRTWRFEFNGVFTNANGDQWDGLNVLKANQTVAKTQLRMAYQRQGQSLSFASADVNDIPAIGGNVFEYTVSGSTPAYFDHITYITSDYNNFVNAGGITGSMTITKIDLGLA